MFTNIAHKVSLPDLETLELAGIRCSGIDLGVFLLHHKGLRSLRLENLDITGDLGFAGVLTILKNSHEHLTHFQCKQIAEQSFRTFFETLGDIGDRDGLRIWESSQRISKTSEQIDFFTDSVYVEEPLKYVGRAEEWENVQQKIGLLRQDLRISDTSYLPDLGTGWYHWGQ